ncbi:hypothetical protein COLO4_02980 [Corchorus olitorius]|uniref:Uncharacterized protein n=1 Tax=Corchorus olitorius TaxID=93759 RepID=A0A1R3KZR7_9ROSI|nr:hypothetical protein COLO4_02980 [Corchorus olitorius]
MISGYDFNDCIFSGPVQVEMFWSFWKLGNKLVNCSSILLNHSTSIPASFTTLETSGRSGALSARGVSSNGSGAMYHQIPNPIIVQTATTKRMYYNKANLSSI